VNFQLSEQHRLVRDMARDFAAGEIAPRAEEMDRTKAFPKEILKKAAGLGLMGIVVPEEYGGAGMDFLSYIIILEEIGRVCASTCVVLSVHNTLFIGGLLKFGSEAQKRAWLPRAASGEILGAYLLTEPGAGSDAGSLKLRAERVEGGWRLTGSKSFITNGGVASHGIVYGRTDPEAGTRGISAFLFDMNAEGITRGAEEKKMGLNASSTVQVTFEDVFVPEENLLGEENRGFTVAMEILNAGRIGIAAQALGIAQAALDESLAYSAQREQFGTTINRFQSIQWFLSDMATEIEAARLLTYRAAVWYGEGRRIIKEAAMAKLFASAACMRAVDKAVQIHGGYGYTRDYKVARLFRDAKVTEIYEGTSEVQHIVIARALATGT
jgi:alkylation response protein AidB-like acyl-CoA dehydrogenase